MNPRSPLARSQTKRLAELSDLGICTDESLSTHLRSLGQPCSRSAISRYREGNRAAPLGLLDLLLSHASPDERVAILELWARPFGLAVVPEEGTSSGPGLLGLALELVSLVGRVVGIVRGQAPSPEERWQVRMLAGELRRTATHLEVTASDSARRAA